MRIAFPSYFNDFHCIAAACPDSCCKEWAVDVDPQSAEFYRRLPGDLGDRLRTVLVDTEDGTQMEIENGRCPMWRQDGLCRIQAELGHDALCKTCRDFPRLRHDYGDFVELGLELSCPEAARLILTAPTFSWVCEDRIGGDAPDYDPEAMSVLLQSREQALRFLNDTRYCVSEALAILLLYGHTVQGVLDGGDGLDLDPEDCLDAAKHYASRGDCEAVADFFRQLEILTDEWKNRLSGAAGSFKESESLRAMARYMVSRYWLQAVSDYDLVCRVKLTVAACLLVGTLGGDPIQTAQLFSKEIENDPDNVESILDGAYTSPALSDTNLLGILLAKNF